MKGTEVDFCDNEYQKCALGSARLLSEAETDRDDANLNFQNVNASDTDADRSICRICLDVENDPKNDPFLKPCRCSGSMAFVHDSCLTELRVSGYDPKTLSECSVCKTRYRLVNGSGEGTDEENPSVVMWKIILSYLVPRCLLFLGCVIALGFMWSFILPEERLVTGDGVIWIAMDHLLKGFVQTLMAAGVFASYNSIYLMGHMAGRDGWRFASPGKLFSRRGSMNSSDSKDLVVVLALIGLVFLLYHVVKGLYHLIIDAQATGIANVRNMNRKAREELVEKYTVLNWKE